MDPAEYEDGRGKVRVRGRLETSRDGKTITVRQIAYSTTTESLIASVESAVQKGKLKVSSIDDRTAEEVEIVLHLSRGVYADEVVPQLYAYTQCEVSISSNVLVIRGNKPAEMTVTEVLTQLTRRLRRQIKAELELELSELEDQRHFLTLEQIFIENRVYKRIETAKTAKTVRREVWDGMEEYREFFIRDMSDEDVERLLQIRIRRISVYDINKYRRQIDDIVRAIRAVKAKLRALTATTISYLEDLVERYGDAYPRRTEITAFDVVSKQEVARPSLKVSYDPATGFFGTAVKGKKYQLAVSEYDKILIVAGDGTYRFVEPPEKLFVTKKVLALEVFNKDEGIVLTYIYRDPDKLAWGKKIHITGFIKDKEYELIKGGKGKVERLYVGEVSHLVHLTFVPMKRQRKKDDWYNLAHLGVSGLASRGTKMAAKPVQWIKIHKSKG